MATLPQLDQQSATDRELLSRYMCTRDERAFSALVSRYCQLILGVAWRKLRNRQDAEDVFQATILVLARDAGKIRQRQALAGWLYGVASRTAARVAKQRARQRVPLEDTHLMVTDDPLVKLSAHDEQQVIDQELERLPESLRSPMVLRYLVGKTNAEVAQAMQVSESAVEGRLKRAKDQLRLRLARQGITLGAALGALEATRSTAPAAEAAALVENTVSSCLHGHEVGAESTGGVSEEVMQLAKQEIMTMTSSSLAKTVIVGCIAVGIVAVGWGLRQGVLWAQADDSPFATEIQVTTEANNAADLFGATIKAAPPSAQAAAEQSRISGRFDLKHMSAWEKKILAALAEPTSFEFSEQPLAEAILFLEDTHDIEIEIDKPALEDIGIDATSTLISRNLSGISLRSALDLVLRDLRLEAVMHDEVLMITTEEVAETMMEARVYNLEMAAPQLERLVKLIPEVVAPDSWKESGGPGFIGAYGSGLVISQTSRIHDEINELLDQLNRL